MRTDSRGLQVCCVVLTLVKVFADTRWPEPSTATTVLPGLTHLRECVSRRCAPLCAGLGIFSLTFTVVAVSHRGTWDMPPTPGMYTLCVRC